MSYCAICLGSRAPYPTTKHSICGVCYGDAQSIVTVTKKIDKENSYDHKSSGNSSSSPNSAKGLGKAVQWVKEMKEYEELQKERINYLSGIAVILSDGIHTDIEVKPGNDGPSIPAHKALLAARSSIFRKMLDSDECKPNHTITFSELNHEELSSLLEFLYRGSLEREKIERHVYTLLVAADKYEMPFLKRFCESHMLGSLSTSNALDVLEISDTCSNQSLKDTALNFIVRNMEDVVFSERFEAFALKNPHLSLQITRASFTEIRNKRIRV